MAEFALLIDGEFREIRNLAERPPNIEHKNVVWLPVTRGYGEPFQGVEGDAYVIRTVDPATLPTKVPDVISDRQFAQALKDLGVITHAEAMAFVQTGTVPAALQAVIDAMPDQQERETAELLLAGATEFRRDHPMTEALRAAMGWTEGQADDLWRAGAQL